MLPSNQHQQLFSTGNELLVNQNLVYLLGLLQQINIGGMIHQINQLGVRVKVIGKHGVKREQTREVDELNQPPPKSDSLSSDFKRGEGFPHLPIQKRIERPALELLR